MAGIVWHLEFILFQERNDIYISLRETLYITSFKFFYLKGYVTSKNC